MSLIGMPEAARRAGMTSDGIRRSLMNAGISLIRINEKAIAVDEAELAAFVQDPGSQSWSGQAAGGEEQVEKHSSIKG